MICLYGQGQRQALGRQGQGIDRNPFARSSPLHQNRQQQRDADAVDRQIVISTHSPIVVDWCSPHALRLVMRDGTVTNTSSLSVEEAHRVAEYLDDEGTLGDFVFMRDNSEQ